MQKQWRAMVSGPALDRRSHRSLIESSFPTNGGLELVDTKRVLVTGGAVVRNWDPRSVPSYA